MRIAALILALCASAGAQVFGSGSVPAAQILCLGDSMTVPLIASVCYGGYAAQQWSSVLPKPQFCTYLFYGLNGCSFTNGYPSSASPTTTINQSALTNLCQNRRSDIPAKAMIFAGSNGMALSNAPAAAEFTGLTNLMNFLLTNATAPYVASNILFIGCLPRQGSNDLATFETNRQFFNNLIITNAAVWGYRFYDVRSNANIGAWTAQSNTTYFNADRIHLNDAGHSQLGISAWASMQ